MYNTTYLGSEHRQTRKQNHSLLLAFASSLFHSTQHYIKRKQIV